MKTLLLSLLCLMMLTLGACTLRCNNSRHHRGSHENRQDVPVPAIGFNHIDIEVPLKANITIGSPASVELHGPAGLLSAVHATVDGPTLHIRSEEHTDFDDEDGLTADIRVPSLEYLRCNGAVDARIRGAWTVSEFRLEADGASEIGISGLTATTLRADMSGAVRLKMSGGSLGTGDFTVSGAGTIRAFGTPQQQCRLSLSGAGTAEVSVSATLHAEISGAGTVRYKGHPAVTQDVNGAGEIVDAN